MRFLTFCLMCRRVALVAALLAGAFTFGHSRSARAELVTGLDAALTVDAVILTGSLISIGGNAADLAQKTPHRAWIYSGFILGVTNLAAGVITIGWGGDPIEKQGDNICTDPYRMVVNPADPTTSVKATYPCGPSTSAIRFGLGAAQTAIAITNLALAIWNAKRWVAAQREKAPLLEDAKTAQRAVAKPTFRAAPILGQDLAGAPLYGIAVGLTGL